MTLDRLSEAVSTCKACALGTRGHGVPGRWSDGALSALEHHPECKPPYHGGMGPCISRCQAGPLVMILGEAPGAVEQERGKPFVGQSGELLHSMLEEVGLTSYFISNIVKHQPFKDKHGKQQEPSKVEIKACAPFLRAEFDLIQPSKLILLGKTAAKLVKVGNFSMKDVVNTTQSWGFEATNAMIPVLYLYHPAYFLRQRTAPWIVKQMSDWKRSVRMFMGDRPPTYQIERVRCAVHG